MNEHWYLRHGDFRPEKLQPGETLGYPNAQITLEQLSEAGNLFDSEDDAIEASILVRSHLARFKFIRQELQGYTRRNGKRPDNNQPSSPSCRRQGNSDEESQWRSVENTIDPEKWLRMKLIIAFGGDVTSASVALEFINGNPEASEQYRRFKEWEMENHRTYCQAKGIRLGKPTSSEEQ